MKGPAATQRKATPFPGWNADALYFTDNGRTLCGAHLGASAKYSGRDLSGQKIALVTPNDVAEWDALPERKQLGALRCECCGKEASRLHLTVPRRVVMRRERAPRESDRCRGCGHIVDGCAGECDRCFR